MISVILHWLAHENYNGVTMDSNWRDSPRLWSRRRRGCSCHGRGWAHTPQSPRARPTGGEDQGSDPAVAQSVSQHPDPQSGNRQIRQWCLSGGSLNDVLSKFGVTRSVRVAPTFLWQDCTLLRVSMNTKAVISDLRHLKSRLRQFL